MMILPEVVVSIYLEKKPIRSTIQHEPPRVFWETGRNKRLTSGSEFFGTGVGPDKRNAKADIAPYWKVQGQLTIYDCLLLYQRRIVVPKNLQKETPSIINACMSPRCWHEQGLQSGGQAFHKYTLKTAKVYITAEQTGFGL